MLCEHKHEKQIELKVGRGKVSLTKAHGYPEQHEPCADRTASEQMEQRGSEIVQN